MASIFDHVAGGGDPGTYAEAPSIGLGATPRNALTGAGMPATTPAQFNALLAAGGAT